MTVTLNTRSVYLVAENLGDWTKYHVSLAELPNAVQVTVGGAHPPFIGGVIPSHMIDAFQQLVVDWMYDVKNAQDKHFQDVMFNWSPFLHLAGKQSQGYYNKWDLAVGVIFAWLFYWKAETNETAALVVGFLYNNDKESTKHILEKVMAVLY